MQVSELLKGQWLEYSGGSRPGTNKIRFVEAGQNTVLLELWYVFDWNTQEAQSLVFHLSRDEFDRLMQGLLEEGHASLDKSTDDQQLYLECRRTPDGFAFRLKGHTVTSFESPVGLELTDFRTVNCGKLLAR